MIRRLSTVPVIMLTARDLVEDKILDLNSVRMTIS
jgi:DNA-binding response OmpR family regulator